MTDFQPPDPGFKSRIQRSFASQPFINFLGASLDKVEPGAIDIVLAVRPELTQQHGYVHGGALTTLGDVAAAYAAMTLAPATQTILTTELKVNFLRPANTASLVARARVIKPGRALCVADCNIVDASEKHVLTGLFTMMYMEGLEP